MTELLLALMLAALGVYGRLIHHLWQSQQQAELEWTLLPLVLLGALFVATAQSLGRPAGLPLEGQTCLSRPTEPALRADLGHLPCRR